MATQITLPRLSPGMNEASVARWLKKAGDTVKNGEALFEVETEKVATEVPAPADGILTIVVPEGKTVAIGTVLAVIAEPGEKVDVPGAAPAAAVAPAAAPTTPAASPAAPAAAPATTPAAPAAAPSAVPAAPAAPPPSVAVIGANGPAAEGRIVASPAARRLARELGVDMVGLRGSGPGGRIIERDVQAAHAAPRPAAVAAPVAPAPSAPLAPAPAAPTPGAAIAAVAARTVALTGMRRVIADRMLQSQNTNATVTLTLEVDMSEATTLRQQLIGEWEKSQGVRVTYGDLIVKAVTKALLEHPRLNATIRGDQIVEQSEVHMGVAVALDDGLVVPVIRNVERKSLLDISRETRDLAERARANRVGVAEISGGTFTITNLGTYGIDSFTPIINPPECAILGVGKITQKPVARDGQVVIRPMMWLSLTFDHRVVDGAPAAQFLKRVQDVLEKPYLIFV
jgi:pyruvate dehydrogenase E2 component (dihydrolipoamide acetyltransferase)